MIETVVVEAISVDQELCFILLRTMLSPTPCCFTI